MIIERFQQQVKKFPGKLAIKTQTASLTYEQLDKLSNGIANKIRAISGERNEKGNIGVLLDSGPDMIAAILGILKSGNAYVPLVAEFPVKRTNFIIHHAEIDIFITDSINKDRVSNASKDKEIDWIMMEDIKNKSPALLWDRLTFARDSCEDTDAYLLYTSGSTGFPKGVRQTRRNILHFIDQYTENLELTHRDNLTLFCSFSHDASVMDIYSALLNGATLFPMDLKQVGIFSILAQWLKKEKITVWHSVPTVYRYFTASLAGKLELPGLRYVVLGGEAVLRSDIEKFRSLFPMSCRLYNLYGQTESTYNSGEFFTAGQPGDDTDEIPITLGEPVQGTELVVVDEAGDETDPLEVGEIIVISDYVSPGYWKDEKSSREKFIHDSEAGRIYFTGDLGCCLPEGRIEYLGRKDHQVKLRGYRVELGEIENTVLQYDSMEQAVVVSVESVSRDCKEIFTACYFSAGKDIHMGLLREFLQERLLDYMVPAYFRQLDHLPMTISGKIDRKALPAPTLEIDREYAAPTNEIEKKLIEIWAELLDIGKEVIGIDNSFFRLGGHSLKATLLAAEIFKEFKVNVSLAEVFKSQTVKELSQYIQQAVKNDYRGIEPVEKREYYPLSSAQKRMYFLHQLEGIATTYNMPFLFKLRKSAHREHMENTCKQLLERHEILRTSFQIVGQDLVQRIHEPGEVDFVLEYNEVTPGKEQEIFKSFIRPFDLDKAPLMRLGLLKVNNQYTFLSDFHHIIVDGISQNLLEADFLALYDGRTLPALNVLYKDYTQWQNSQPRQTALKKQKEYWLETLTGQLPVLELPYDYPRPFIQDFEGATVCFILKERETMRLKEVSGELSATLFMMLLAAYNVLLWRLSNHEDIIVGTPIAVRNHADLQNLAGMLVNMLILRNYPTGTQRFADLLMEVKEHTIAAYENQEFPFDDLVEFLAVPRDTSRNPIFDISFNLLDERNYHFDIEGELEQSALIYLNDTSKFDLSLTVMDRGHGLVFRFEYCTRLFKAGTLERIMQYFKNILSVILIDPWVKLSDMEILPGGEKKKILEMGNGVEMSYDWNQTIDRLFEVQANQTPDHVALLGENPKFESPAGHLYGNPKHKAPFGQVLNARGENSLRAKSQELRAITYKGLNEKSNQLARLLQEKGVQPDTIVVIMMERSIEMIIGIMGILKAGAAYLPIDPEYPEERIKYMLKDSNVRVLLTTPKLQVKVKAEVEENFRQPRGLPLQFINIETDLASTFEPPPSTLTSTSTCQVSPANLAYLIYTSGSTGKPKGVMVEHRGLVNLMKYHHQYTNLDCSRVTQFASISFDVSFQEIFFTLLAGGMLVVLDRQTKTDIPRLCRVIRENRVQTVFLPVSFIRAIFSDEDYASQFPGTIGHIVSAGEQMVVIDRFRVYLQENNIYLHNHYGPSETHVVTTLTLEPKGEIPELPAIGTPISNTKIYILGKALYLQPINVVGELYIGGAAVGRGYLNNPELISEKFVHDLWDLQDYRDKEKKVTIKKNNKKFLRGGLNQWVSSMIGKRSYESLDMIPRPHPETNENQHKRFAQHIGSYYPRRGAPGRRRQEIYRTGDLARWLADANIEFLGRIDQQVKIRGFRIEPGEIQHLLLKQEDVKDAVVVTKEDQSGDRYLCAYIVPDKSYPHEPPYSTDSPHSPHSSHSTKLREYLSSQLPDYMIPWFFVYLEEIPLTANGKIDRKALPEPGSGKVAPGQYQPPRDELEEKLVKIWSEILPGRDSLIGIDDNFFDLGGHSLKATVLMVHVHKAFNVSIPLSRLFKTPTIRTLASCIRNAAKDKYISLEITEKKEFYPLSAAQKRLYIVHQLDPESINYNMPTVINLGGKVDRERMKNTLNKLIHRHEVLRTSIQLIDGLPFQKVYEKMEVEIEYHIAGSEAQSDISPTGIINNFLRPFDLSCAPLLRVGLIKTDQNHYILMADMHHIITDATSNEILENDLVRLYEGETLGELKYQYKDFSQWQTRQIVSGEIKKQEEYWLKEFAGKPPLLNIPTDYPRAGVMNREGKKIRFAITSAETEKLKELARKENATMFMVALTLFYILLYKISRQEDIVIGTMLAGRRHRDLEDIMGFFVNTLVLRNYPRGDKIFIRFLAEVRNRTLDAFDNQDYQFEDLVEKLMLDREPGRNPLFDAAFSFVSRGRLNPPSSPSTNQEAEKTGLNKTPQEIAESTTTKFDLLFTGVDASDTINFNLRYRTGLFKKETIEKLIEYFKKIVSAVCADEYIQLKNIKISHDLEAAESDIYDTDDVKFEF